MRLQAKVIIAIPLLLLSIRLSSQAKPSSETVYCPQTSDSLDGQLIERFAEEMPQFLGGNTQMLSFLMQNIQYPPIGLDDWCGTIYATFVIDTAGKIRNACIIKRNGNQSPTALEKEVLRVILLMPDWIPGKHQTKKVPIRFNLPIRIEPR